MQNDATPHYVIGSGEMVRNNVFFKSLLTIEEISSNIKDSRGICLSLTLKICQIL